MGNEQLEERISFWKRKDIEISTKRYLQDAMSAMALGLFATLLMGTILDVLGTQTANLFGENAVSAFLVEIAAIAKDMKIMGAGIGVAVATALKAPPLVIYSCAAVGAMGATLTGFGITMAGGPAGAFVAVAVGAEFGKMVSKETKVDILVTPRRHPDHRRHRGEAGRPGGRLVSGQTGRGHHGSHRMAAVLFRDLHRGHRRTGTDGAHLQRGDLRHDGTVRSGGRSRDCRLLRPDGRVRCSEFP